MAIPLRRHRSARKDFLLTEIASLLLQHLVAGLSHLC